MTKTDTISCPQCGAEVEIGDAEPLARVLCPGCGERVRITRSFNHFELRETLGTGGMGTVYKAYDTQLDREVALKLLRKDLGPEYANQLQKEARVTASINHPNVVQVFSVGRDHDQYYLVMELVECGTLDDLIAERKKLPEAEVLRTGIEIARGLRAAYRKGLIHRDVKPANILFNADGMAKISDFGLAGIAGPQTQASEVIWGTPYYIAPERLNNQPEDFRSDIYSLGATLFHAVAGRPPFEGETTFVAVLRALKNNPLKLKKMAPEVSSATASAIETMIAPDPRMRFISHDAAIAALEKSERILRGETELWRTKAALLAASALIFAMGMFGWFFFSGHQVRSKGNREFKDARQQLIDGKYKGAHAAFARLASETKKKQPMYDWALLNQATAALLDSEDSETRKALQEVENAGSGGFADPQLGLFLLDTARRANTRSTIVLSDISEHPAKPFALFLLGLMDVHLGRFNDAVALLETFTRSQPNGSLSWVAEYKSIAKKYLEDSREWLAWREQNGSAKSAVEIKSALDNLRRLIPKLQKQTAISREAGLEEKMLANRLAEIETADSAQREKQHQDLLARETPQWNAALESYRRRVANYDFAGAAAAIRKARVSDPSLKQTQGVYVQAAKWMAEWKATLIKDLNTRGYNGLLEANNAEYTGIAGATATTLRVRNFLGLKEIDWLKISAPSLLRVSISFATDADRNWRCGVFAWTIGQTDTAGQLFNAACSAKPSYNEARKLFDQTKR